MEYQRIAAAGFFLVLSTDSCSLGCGFWKGAGDVAGGFVFGTLLGPEATGPWRRFPGGFPLWGSWWGVVVWDLCFSFLAAPIMRVCVCGVCGMGLLFENYIVDASIFYKKQFPRI